MMKKVLVLLCMSVLCFVTLHVNAQTEAPKLLPFQGRLTDQTGSPVPDGMTVMQFKIYNQPTGGTPVWPGELHTTSVNGGLVNVLLGTMASLENVDFNQQLYLEITVDINDDDLITEADPPMLPRQIIQPAVFSKESADSRLLAGYDWSALMEDGSNNPVDSKIAENKMPSGILVPIGGVIMWWGSVIEIPTNFELCDGQSPSTPGAVLDIKPDLRDSFVKGASTSDTTRADLGNGGSHTISERTSGGTALTVAQIPAHNHGVSDPGHNHLEGTWGYNSSVFHAYGDIGLLSGSRPCPCSFCDNSNSTQAYTQTKTTGVTINNTGSGSSHTHSISSHDNRPLFKELYFIIRVK